MSETCLNLSHVSCMFENMSRLSGLCWNESSIVRKRRFRELRRGKGGFLLGKVSSWTEVRKETIKTKQEKKEEKGGGGAKHLHFFARLKDQGLDPTHYKR